MANLKLIYSKKIAIDLRKRGFRITNTEVNTKHPQFDVYFFEATPELLTALTEIIDNQ